MPYALMLNDEVQQIVPTEEGTFPVADTLVWVEVSAEITDKHYIENGQWKVKDGKV